MERVKQRIIETIIQINRTHTLPAYGILLIGPAGTGKSQIAYAIARILKLPWTTLDMSSINDPEQLTGSSRVYANAKPGIIMEAFAAAGESNLVFIINELDKAASGKGNGNPADYTPEEKKIIFSRFALPKILKRMSLRRDECTVTDEGLDVIIELYSNTSGIRDLEQAAEHIAANALYQIEVNHVKEVVFDGEAVRALLS